VNDVLLGVVESFRRLGFEASVKPGGVRIGQERFLCWATSDGGFRVDGMRGALRPRSRGVVGLLCRHFASLMGRRHQERQWEAARAKRRNELAELERIAAEYRELTKQLSYGDHPNMKLVGDADGFRLTFHLKHQLHAMYLIDAFAQIDCAQYNPYDNLKFEGVD